MDFIVNPTLGLLDAESSPLLLAEQFSFVGDYLHDGKRQDHVPVLVVGIAIFFRVLDLIWIVRHKNYRQHPINSKYHPAQGLISGTKYLPPLIILLYLRVKCQTPWSATCSRTGGSPPSLIPNQEIATPISARGKCSKTYSARVKPPKQARGLRGAYQT